MIKLVRIDDRLLHGQVAFAWTRSLEINYIIVADDSVVKDQFRQMSLKLAKPPEVKLSLVGINDAIELLNSSETNKYSILVVIENISDALKIANGVKEVKTINIGGIRLKPGAKMISKSVSIDADDKNNLKELINKGIEVEIRQVPTERKILVKDLI